MDKMALESKSGFCEKFQARLKSERERCAGIIWRLDLKVKDWSGC